VRDRTGQATLELVLSSGLVAVTVVAAGWTLYAGWERSRCAYLTFESAHLRLTGQIRLPGRRVEVEEDEDGVSAQGRCRAAVETVRLQRLEKIAW
jgi:hypothetical protein